MPLSLQDVLRALVENMEKAAERLPNTTLVPGRYVVFVHGHDFDLLTGDDFAPQAERVLEKALHGLNRKERTWFGFGPVAEGGTSYGRDRPVWEVELRRAEDAERHVAPGDVRVESVMQIAHERQATLVMREKTVVTLQVGGRRSTSVRVRDVAPGETTTEPTDVVDEANPRSALPEEPLPPFEPVDSETARRAVATLRVAIRKALAEAGVPLDPPG